jgi:hypothetical protein
MSSLTTKIILIKEKAVETTKQKEEGMPQH